MILVTGAGGFVGVHLLKRLSAAGSPVRALVRCGRDAERLRRVVGPLCQPAIPEAKSLQSVMQGVDQVIHLAGIFREGWKQTFEAVHCRGTRRLMEAARNAEVRHVVYVSTLGAAQDPIYPFVYSKWLGEEEVRRSGLPFTILRPSLLFGEEDHFLMPLKRLLKSSSYVFIPGLEPLRCQPLWVGDLVSCLVRTVDDGVGKGEAIALAGPDPVTFEEVVDLAQRALGTRRRKVAVPLSLAVTLTLLIERVMGAPPLTTGVLDIWRLGAVTSPGAVQSAYGLTPMPLAEGASYLLSSGGPPWRPGSRGERLMTPNRSS